MPEFPIFQVDAFTSKRFAGNPAAVVIMEEFPVDEVLHQIAAENNLAETAFVVPEEGHYLLRWFTPTVEVPLCGHGTLAAAAVVMERLVPARTHVMFQTASGPLTVTREQGRYIVNLPTRWPIPVVTAPGLAAALGVEPQEVLEDGFNYMAVLSDANAVRNLAPDIAAIARLDRVGVIVTAPGDGPYDCISRYFTPAKGISEDPVTGGAHCALTPYWTDRLKKQRLHAFQASRRGGEIGCRLLGERVELEGECVFYLQGQITI